MEQNTRFSILNSAGGIIAALIPIVQFTFGWFPTHLNKIFIDENTVFFTTALAFLFSIFVVILVSVNRRIFTFFGKYIHLDNVANSSLLVVFFFSLVFLSIGIHFKQEFHPWLALVQSVTYIITIAGSVLFIVVYSLDVTRKKNDQEIEVSRARRAISLAIEHDSFIGFPRINFIKAESIKTETSSSEDFKVTVKIENTGYDIKTNGDASVLKEVVIKSN